MLAHPGPRGHEKQRKRREEEETATRTTKLTTTTKGDADDGKRREGDERRPKTRPGRGKHDLRLNKPPDDRPPRPGKPAENRRPGTRGKTGRPFFSVKPNFRAV
jgi:hypothetical protein